MSKLKLGVWYNMTTVDTYDEVVPWLNGYFWVLVSQDLEAKSPASAVGARRGRVGVKARYETVEGPKHFVVSPL